ncbi:MAG TPA: hypothetical protein VEP91_11645 [Solirubrobacterales bacterium]|nr:hypothetical protein [Solirubrobacterales bacterium]
MAADMSLRLPDDAALALRARAESEGVAAGRLAAEIVCAELGAEAPPLRHRPAAAVSAEVVRACEGGATISDVAGATGATYSAARLRLNRAAAGGLLRKRAGRGSRAATYEPTDLGRRVAGAA